MPLIDVGFIDPNGKPDGFSLGYYGPTVVVEVKHLVTNTGGTLTEPEKLPSEPSESVYALIDTGAWESCIDTSLAERLELPIIDMMLISGASGAVEHPVYLAQVDIPTLGFYQYGRFAGVELINGGQEHCVLLGRTFLSNVIMIYDGVRGQVTLAR